MNDSGGEEDSAYCEREAHLFPQRHMLILDIHGHLL